MSPVRLHFTRESAFYPISPPLMWDMENVSEVDSLREWGAISAFVSVHILRATFFSFYGDCGRAHGLIIFQRQFAVDCHSQFCPSV